MLQCDGIDASEGININEASKSKECMLCHYWYFNDVGLDLNHIFVIVVLLFQ